MTLTKIQWPGTEGISQRSNQVAKVTFNMKLPAPCFTVGMLFSE